MNYSRIKKVPASYEQPVQNFIGRTLNGQQEQVDYIPESHMRIWYNNQPENYTMHHHNAMEIIVCMKNEYVVMANSQKYVLNVGDILIIPPHKLHELICNSYGIRFIFLINMEMINCLKDYQTLDPVFMEPYLCNANTRPHIYQQVYASLMQMIDIYFSNETFWEASIYSLILGTLVTIGRDYFGLNEKGSDPASQDKKQEYYEKFANLLSYIDANYTEDLTLEQAADFIGFSKFHFSRLFKQYTNTTFYEYLCHKRIQAAQSMLTMDIPITDIAFQTGFNNLTTFCRCFKKFTDCSPTEYRNKFRKEAVR